MSDIFYFFLFSAADSVLPTMGTMKRPKNSKKLPGIHTIGLVKRPKCNIQETGKTGRVFLPEFKDCSTARIGLDVCQNQSKLCKKKVEKTAKVVMTPLKRACDPLLRDHAYMKMSRDDAAIWSHRP